MESSPFRGPAARAPRGAKPDPTAESKNLPSASEANRGPGPRDPRPPEVSPAILVSRADRRRACGLANQRGFRPLSSSLSPPSLSARLPFVKLVRGSLRDGIQAKLRANTSTSTTRRHDEEPGFRRRTLYVCGPAPARRQAKNGVCLPARQSVPAIRSDSGKTRRHTPTKFSSRSAHRVRLRWQR